MSRTNSKAARILRENESLAVRKKVLRAGGANPYTTSDALDSLAQSNDQYVEKLAKLNEFKSKSKDKTKKQSNNVEWIREQSSLASAANLIERDISSAMEVLLLHTPDDELILDLIGDIDMTASQYREHKRSVTSQLHDIKSMLSDTITGIQSANSTQIKTMSNGQQKKTETAVAVKSQRMIQRVKGAQRGGNTKIDDADCTVDSRDESVDASVTLGTHKWAAVVPIFADLLMQIRTKHHENWHSLKEDEVDIFEQLLGARRHISRMLRSERHEEQNERIKSDLQLTEGDDADVEMFMEEWFHRLHVLDKAHTTECQVIAAERRSAIMSLGLDPEELHGGWSPGDHDTFVKVVKETQSGGLSRRVMDETLRTQLPLHSDEDISLHEEWHRAVRSFASRKKEAVASYETSRAELLVQAKAQLEQFRASKAEARQREESLRQHEANRAKLHERLSVLRDKKDQEDEVLAAAERARQEEQRRVAEERALAEAAEQADKKKAVEEFRAVRAKEAQERAEQDRLREEEEQAALREAIEANRGKVEQREQLRREKEQARMLKEMEKEEEEARRLEALMKIAQQVPYWDDIQNAESKLDHITASVKAHEYVRGDDLTRGHMPLNGFTDGKVISDARFRLATALREAGVHQSAAAKAAVAAMNPRPHLAIHGIL